MRKREKVQGALIFIIGAVFYFSSYLPVIITSYMMLSFIFLDLFHHIRTTEMKKDDEDNKNFLSQTITFILFQTLSFGALLLITWVLLDKKLHLLE